VSRSTPRRQQITITIPPDMLQRLDALAQETGQTRAGLLLLGASRLLRDGV
jgi:predicted DNA-binding protein